LAEPVGVLECWSLEKRHPRSKPKLHHSNTPKLNEFGDPQYLIAFFGLEMRFINLRTAELSAHLDLHHFAHKFL
jgi:hypothetical protein